MNKSNIASIFFVVATLFVPFVHAQEMNQISSIDISSQQGQANVFIRPGSVLKDDSQTIKTLRDIVTVGSSTVLASVQSNKLAEPDGQEIFELGSLDIEMILNVRPDDVYRVQIAVGLQSKTGKHQKVSQYVETPILQAPVFSETLAEQLVADFKGVVQGEFAEYQSNYGPEFIQAVQIFTSEYILGVMDTAPQVVAAMIERDQHMRKLEENEKKQPEPTQQAVTAHEQTSVTPVQFQDPLPRNKTRTKGQRNYLREEVVNIRPEEFSGRIIQVPEYLTVVSFDLFEEKRTDADVEQPLAKIEYFVATVPTPFGQYQTTFILQMNYQMSEITAHTKTMLHDRVIDESTFFPRWKEKFLKPALQKLMDAAKDDEDRKKRSFFSDYLEPFMFDEYYDFSPLFIKAKMAFEQPATKKMIEEVAKDYNRAMASRKS